MAGHIPTGTATRQHPSVRPGRGSADLAWLALLVAAVLVPVEATARWLHPTYTTTLADLGLGIWLLKACAALLAVSGLALDRMRLADVPSIDLVRPARSPIAIPAGIALLALALRLYALDTELWLDEIEMLIRYVPLEFRQLVSTYDTQNHHPLYTILARLAWLLAGGSEWAVRLPAVLFGVAGILVVRQFARTIVSEAEANLSALVLAVSYHHVWFSQNARGYTAILFFCVAASWAFLRLCDRPGPRPARTAWVYAALMAAATWTHLTAALIAVGHLVALLVTADWRAGHAWRRVGWPLIGLSLSGLLAIALYAPMLPQVVHELTAPPAAAASVSEVWTDPRWMVAEAIRTMASGIPGGALTVAMALLVPAIGVTSLWRLSRRATLVMFVPVAVTAAAVIGTGHNFWPRFFFFAAGFLVLAAVRGGFAIVRTLVRWHPDRVAMGGAMAVAALSLLTVPPAWEPKQQFRAALDYVDGAREPGDAVVALDVAYNVYLLRGWAPEWYLTRSASRLSQVEEDAGRTWVVYTLPTRLRAIAPALWERVAPPRYDVVRVFPATVGGGEIHVLRRDNPDRDD